MTSEKEDTLKPVTLVVEDDIPLPKDRRLGKGQLLPTEMKEVMSSMKVGQSFFMETTLDEQKGKIAAIRAAVQRYIDQSDNPIAWDWVFSVRKENDPFRLGVRVFRMEDRDK
tara:strand:+ start:4527 stop:4862 length:336 start_codon:yes stop_codon:yes gene_type:complete